MSTHDGPPRRRRIAGEAKPSDTPRTGPARKVVKKPVTRPGSASSPTPASAPEEQTTGPAEEDTTPAPAADVAAEQVADGDGAAAPRVAPRIGRRPGRVATAPDADAATPPSSTPEVEPSGPRRRPQPGRVLLVAMTVAALVFGAFFGYRGVVEWRQTHGVDGAHAQAAETAASAAETIFSYRYDQLDQYLEDSKDVMTPSFAKEFETISPALNDLAPQRKIQVEATARDAAALPCGDDCTRSEATVLLFVDQARLADGSQVPTVFGNRVELSMVERDGRWLVDDIKAL